MELFWLLLGLAGWAVMTLLVLVLMRMSRHQDQIARKVEMEINLGIGAPVPNFASRTGNDDPPRLSIDGSNHG